MSNQPCMRRTSFRREAKPSGKEINLEAHIVHEVADNTHVKPLWQGCSDVVDFAGRSWTRRKIEGHDDRTARVSNTPACSRDKGGLAADTRLRAHAAVRHIFPGGLSQVLEQHRKSRKH
eukprot:6187511-Pleurochrysis_carterae.AAC.3